MSPPLSQDQGSAILVWLPHKKTIWVSAWHMYIMSRARQQSVSAWRICYKWRACVSATVYAAHMCALRTAVRIPIPLDQIERPADRVSAIWVSKTFAPHATPAVHCMHSVCRAAVRRIFDDSSRGIPMTIFPARWKVISWWNASIVNKHLFFFFIFLLAFI